MIKINSFKLGELVKVTETILKSDIHNFNRVGDIGKITETRVENDIQFYRVTVDNRSNFGNWFPEERITKAS